MDDHFSNLTQDNLELKIEPYMPTSHYLLTFDFFKIHYSFLMTEKQMAQLRDLLSNFHTTDEIEQMTKGGNK